MKTPNLDREIETYEIHKKQGYLTKYGENYLAEFKAIKQALIIADVSISLERAKKYAEHQHYRGTINEPLVEFEEMDHTHYPNAAYESIFDY